MTTQDSSPASSNSYEFTPDQNRMIEELSGAIDWVSLPLQVIGVFYAISTIGHFGMAFAEPRLFLSVLFIGLGAFLFLCLGNWNRQAARSFRQVAQTSGRDIEHLMTALENLRKKYAVLAFFVKLHVAILILGLIAGIILWATGNLS